MVCRVVVYIWILVCWREFLIPLHSITFHYIQNTAVSIPSTARKLRGYVVIAIIPFTRNGGTLVHGRCINTVSGIMKYTRWEGGERKKESSVILLEGWCLLSRKSLARVLPRAPLLSLGVRNQQR